TTSRALTPPSFLSFHRPATTQIYALSLHDALPIFHELRAEERTALHDVVDLPVGQGLHAVAYGVHADDLDVHAGLLAGGGDGLRSEEHTSELQSRENLVCRLLLEKKNRRAASRAAL